MERVTNTNENINPEKETVKQNKLLGYFRKLGVAGIIFFTVKGTITTFFGYKIIEWLADKF